MSDHNFEKQIQQKLDELKIPPSDHLWSSVEARIRQDRRRRRGVIFFPVFVLLLVGAGFYFSLQNHLSSSNNSVSKSTSAIATGDNTDNNSTTETAKTAGELNQKQTGEKEAGNAIQPATKNLPDEQRVDESQLDHAAVKPLDLKNSVAKNTSRTRQQTASGKSVKKKELVVIEDQNGRTFHKNNRTVTAKSERKVSGDNETVYRNASEQGKSLLVGLSAAQEEVPNNKRIDFVAQQRTSQVDVAVEKKILDSAANLLARMQALPLDSAATPATVEESKAASRKVGSSLKWGFSGSVGMSNLSDGGFFSGIFDGLLGGQKSMVADVSPTPNTGSNATPAVVVYQPSEIRKGLSFSLGAFFQKSITKRFSISTGLQYRFYSTHIRVGNRVDSFAMVQNAFGSMNINQYYRAAPVPVTQEYTNRFHFVELPLSGHLQLNKGNRLPIFWNAGISLSYLVSTSVLHFDSRTGLYYKDNELLNRLQAGMSTGFAVTLLNASRLSVQLGPQFQYNFTDLMKQEVSDGKHLFYFGLNTRVFFNK